MLLRFTPVFALVLLVGCLSSGSGTAAYLGLDENSNGRQFIEEALSIGKSNDIWFSTVVALEIGLWAPTEWPELFTGTDRDWKEFSKAIDQEIKESMSNLTPEQKEKVVYQIRRAKHDNYVSLASAKTADEVFEVIDEWLSKQN